jgi:hypothetical protein
MNRPDKFLHNYHKPSSVVLHVSDYVLLLRLVNVLLVVSSFQVRQSMSHGVVAEHIGVLRYPTCNACKYSATRAFPMAGTSPSKMVASSVRLLQVEYCHTSSTLDAISPYPLLHAVRFQTVENRLYLLASRVASRV